MNKRKLNCILQSNKKIKIMETIKDQNEFNALLSKGIKDFENYEYLGERLNCSNNQLVKLPALNACKWLDCSYNQLVKLPALNACKWLNCSNNQLVKLPALKTCKTLNCYNNQLVKLPALNACKWLNCSNNQLVKLPALKTCKTLNCYNNQLVKLPALKTCKTLDCSNNQLDSKYFTISSTSLRSVFFMKNRNVILTGCFCGTPEEFYEKGFVKEKKQWVKDFYNQIKK